MSEKIGKKGRQMIRQKIKVVRFSEYLKKTFGERVQRVSLHAGMTCPNRDGTVGTGGCIYCDNGSFHPGMSADASIAEQMEKGRNRAFKRYGARKFLAYFQTYSNTYASVKKLKRLYSEAISYDDVVGLMIATRPDCLDRQKIEMISEFSQRLPVWLELGVQTCHDETLQLINRGHDRRCTEEILASIRGTGIKVAAHIILGLPGENASKMMQTADWLREMRVDGLKLHHLHAVRGTKLEKMYEDMSWKPMDVDVYIELAAEFLWRQSPGTVVMRLVADCPRELLVAPHWLKSKSEIERLIWDILSNKINDIDGN
ncbi:TIGR01212 family radical SAM protein [bacterium]|nr:TIGR01212 family radical SAM protein [bacterium]